MKRILILSLALFAAACGDHANERRDARLRRGRLSSTSQARMPALSAKCWCVKATAVEAGAQVFRLDPQRLKLRRAERCSATLRRRTPRSPQRKPKPHWRSAIIARGAQLAERKTSIRVRGSTADRAVRDAANARLNSSAPRSRRRSARKPAWPARTRQRPRKARRPAAGTIEQIFHRAWRGRRRRPANCRRCSRRRI